VTTRFTGLSALTSLVLSRAFGRFIMAALFLGSINFFLGLFGLLASSLAGYLGYIFFNTLAEILSPIL